MGWNLLKPALDVLQLLHRHGVHMGREFFVVLEDKHHVKVLEAVFDPLKVNHLHLFKRDNEEGGLGEVNQAEGRGLHEDVGARGDSEESKLPKGFVQFNEAVALQREGKKERDEN